MAKCLQVSYYTLKGVKKLIVLGDLTYGEWIVYNKGIPEYHINVFDDAQSNEIIRQLIESKTETIESIINEINNKQGVRLSLGSRPFLRIVKAEELIELNLTPLPGNWLIT